MTKLPGGNIAAVMPEQKRAERKFRSGNAGAETPERKFRSGNAGAETPQQKYRSRNTAAELRGTGYKACGGHSRNGRQHKEHGNMGQKLFGRIKDRMHRVKRPGAAGGG